MLPESGSQEIRFRSPFAVATTGVGRYRMAKHKKAARKPNMYQHEVHLDATSGAPEAVRLGCSPRLLANPNART